MKCIDLKINLGIREIYRHNNPEYKNIAMLISWDDLLQYSYFKRNVDSYLKGIPLKPKLILGNCILISIASIT